MILRKHSVPLSNRQVNIADARDANDNSRYVFNANVGYRSWHSDHPWPHRRVAWYRQP